MPIPMEEYIETLVGIEDDVANFIWSLNTPIRDFAPADQHAGLHAELDNAKAKIQDEIDRVYRLVRDVQDDAMRARRAA